MKKETWWLLAAVAAVVMAFVPQAGNGIWSLLALPFTAVGWLLRLLFGQGPAGIGAGIALYALVCAAPLVFWWRSCRRTEDGLLILLSGILALVLYYMVNPELRQSSFQNEAGDIIYALPVWSALIAWGVLRLVVTGQTLERNIYRALRIFLLLCAGGCLMDALGTQLRNLLWYLAHFTADVYASAPGRDATLVFLILRYLCRAAEGILTAWVLYHGMKLLDALEADPFSKVCVGAAEEVSRRSRDALTVIVLSSLAMNVGQLLFQGWILNIRMELRLPVMGMAVCFALPSVTKLLVKGKELKEESDLFV